MQISNVTDAERSETSGGIVVEASWAPKDPRDKLYDEDASDKERAESFVRLVGAFHPVMNVPVLLFDLFKMIGFKWTASILTVLIMAVFYLIFG